MCVMSEMNGEIELAGMEFRAFHGCLESERREGNDFVVDFKCVYDITEAAATDRLEDTLDYSGIYDIVAAQMAVPSNLLEHVAGRIVEAIRRFYPELEHFEVRVSKKNPPVSGKVGRSSVTIKV